MCTRFTGAMVIVLLIGGIASLAAPGQVPRPGTERPGELTSGRMWIENRGAEEAIPVLVQQPIALVNPTTVLIRVVQQPWEYRTIIVAAEQDVASVLTRAGAEGWEAVSVDPAGPKGTPVLMKRPR